MKDAKGHGSDKRGGNGRFQTSTGVTAAARERIALRAMVDQRKFLAARTSNRNINPPALYPSINPNARLERTDMPHHRGVDAATLGKNLAAVSAMGATQATVKLGG